MEQTITFRVNGLPAPKGSVTKMPRGQYLTAGTPASRMQFHLWKENIASAARLAMRGEPPWAGAVKVMATFYMPVPTSQIRKFEWGWLPHTKRPDIDKLGRALLDPLTGIAWVDDSQVCYCLINKVYAWEVSPGADVVIDFLDDEWSKELGRVHRLVENVIKTL